MHIEIGKSGEQMVVYDSREEEDAAIRNYLSGNYAALTSDEVLFIRSCDPRIQQP